MIHFFVLLPKASRLGMNFKIMKFTCQLPCEQRFFPCMDFKSFAWLVCRVVGFSQGVNKPTTRETTHANDFVNAKSHAREKPLLAGYLSASSIV